MVSLIIGSLFVLLFGYLTITGYIREKRDWNGGICKHNGLKWTQFDISSQGCRGYTANGEYIWISFYIDK